VENEIKKALSNNLKGAAASTIEAISRRIGLLPKERARIAVEMGIALATSSLRAALEFLRAAEPCARLLEADDMKFWGEIGKRLAHTNPDAAADFFQSSQKTFSSINQNLRPTLLRLTGRQAMLSSSTALECFKSAPEIINSLGTETRALQILNISIELARHSVKQSYEFFLSAPKTIACLNEFHGIIDRALQLTSRFAAKAGGTAADFFAELPKTSQALAASGCNPAKSLEDLLAKTEAYLERSGGVALQYFKAAGSVLALADQTALQKWSSLAAHISAQGNAASYHFMKSSPQIVTDLAARAPTAHRAQFITSVLEIIAEIARRNPIAAIECFKSSPLALEAASLAQFRHWAQMGAQIPPEDLRQTQAYYALESRKSQQTLLEAGGRLRLDSVAQTLRLYVEGLTGRALQIAPLSSVPEEAKIGDGKTIYLPSTVSEFQQEADNFRLLKVLAAHAAGQIEFQTYAKDSPDLVAALDRVVSKFGRRKPQQTTNVDFNTVLSHFPNPELARRLFTTIENGRIDFLLRNSYRGIRRDLDFIREKLLRQRPQLKDLPEELVPFEILFQVAVCGGATGQARLRYPEISRLLEDILDQKIRRPEATVADSLDATLLLYSAFTEQPSQANSQDHHVAGNSAESGSQDSTQPPTQANRSQIHVRGDLLAFWTAGLPQELNPEGGLWQASRAAESEEQDLESGDRAFYYDEWDRELGDYRTRWCRIIEREGARGSRGFVQMVRSRYAGIISSIRYQFQMLRPDALGRIRGEIDGEDYDLEAVIDYAIDKRTTGLINDRLYTRKLRRRRDVAVSFLLDMSSSTARTISRDPSKPYSSAGQRIIDIEKEGLVLMSEALEAVGDLYSMQGFTSEGRRNVKFYLIKDFSEAYSPDVERRIGGITYQNNTRLGAAIRHAAARLAAQEARTKLLIILSDGRPYDHDYGDSRYAREDTRMALRQARLAGITPFCITIDRESEEQLRDMYGEVGYTIIDNILSLPEKLPGIYRRLTTS
jgi:nitric oxide reductase NorD protein